MSSLPFLNNYLADIPVNAGENKVVHRLPLSSFNQLSYFMGVKKSDLSLNRSFNLSVNKLGVGLSDTVSNIIGTVMGYEVHVNVNGSNAEVVIKNNESFPLVVGFRYFKV